tara:strand:+ start:2944 stop:3315 length:372 start_codon:yes stop_codon:yes gene_type:complete
VSWRDIVKAKELTPKQKKLDNNHNGVIDAQDFHIMSKSPDSIQSKEERYGQRGNDDDYRDERDDDEMAKSPNRTHYTKDGKVWRGKTHKMPNGNLMTEDPHNEKSVRLYHKEELTKRRSAFTS